jgi:predicted GIY-YIG superfamily endonuclease
MLFGQAVVVFRNAAIIVKTDGANREAGKRCQKNTRWTPVRLVPGAEKILPPLPGVYVYAEVERTLGIPRCVRGVYVGRASDLSRRCGEHLPRREENARFRQWLRSTRDAELWFVVTTEEESRALERELIRELDPPFNVVRYSTAAAQ